MVEGARLESVCRGNSTEGSNPSLSAIRLTSASPNGESETRSWRATLRENALSERSESKGNPVAKVVPHRPSRVYCANLSFLSNATKRGSERSGSNMRSLLSHPIHCESDA